MASKKSTQTAPHRMCFCGGAAVLEASNSCVMRSAAILDPRDRITNISGTQKESNYLEHGNSSRYRLNQAACGTHIASIALYAWCDRLPKSHCQLPVAGPYKASSIFCVIRGANGAATKADRTASGQAMI